MECYQWLVELVSALSDRGPSTHTYLFNHVSTICIQCDTVSLRNTTSFKTSLFNGGHSFQFSRRRVIQVHCYGLILSEPQESNQFIYRLFSVRILHLLVITLFAFFQAKRESPKYGYATRSSPASLERVDTSPRPRRGMSLNIPEQR